MPPSSTVAVRYCTDEDIVVEAGADFWIVAPPGNVRAFGTDGAFQGGDPWTLLSASNNFLGQGVTSGMVIQLANTPLVTGAKQGTGPFKQPQTLAVDSATTTSVTLRRVGEPLGVGLPPGPSGGLAGVTFRIITQGPKIENVSYELNQQYDIDAKIPLRDSGSIYDPRILRRLTALCVMWHQYANVNRDPKEGDISGKIRFYQNEYSTALDRAVVRWGPTGVSQPPSARRMRVSR